jgi:hypothetical protein
MYFVYTANVTGDHHLVIRGGSNSFSLKTYGSDLAQVGYTEYDSFGALNKTVSMTEGERFYFAVTLMYGAGNLELTLTAPSEEEPGGDELVGGTSFVDAIAITLGETYKVSCDDYGKKVYFKYTAAATGAYHIYVSGSDNSYAQIWKDSENTNQSPIYANWGTGLIDTNLSEFTEGMTYYIVIGISGYTGNLEFILTSPDAEG